MGLELPLTKEQAKDFFSYIFLIGFLFFIYPTVDDLIHKILGSNYWDIQPFIPVIFIGLGIYQTLDLLIDSSIINFKKDGETRPKFKYKLIKVPIEE